MEYLTETEKKSLERLNESPTTIEALRKVLLKAVYFDGTLNIESDPKKNFAFALGGQPNIPDEQIGKHLRACIEAVRMMEFGFDELKKFKKQESPAPIQNPGR